MQFVCVVDNTGHIIDQCCFVFNDEIAMSRYSYCDYNNSIIVTRVRSSLFVPLAWLDEFAYQLADMLQGYTFSARLGCVLEAGLILFGINERFRCRPKVGLVEFAAKGTGKEFGCSKIHSSKQVPWFELLSV